MGGDVRGKRREQRMYIGVESGVGSVTSYIAITKAIIVKRKAIGV